MKILPLFLAGSLVANAALLVVVLKPSAPDKVQVAGARTVTRQSPAALSSTLPEDLRAALASGDVNALTAAGLPPETARHLALGRAYQRQQERLRALRDSTDQTNAYWKREFGPDGYSSRTPEKRAELMKIQRDYREEVRAALGEDPSTALGGHSLAFLPADAREKLRRIEEDYSELMGEVYGEAGGVQLPSDREKLRLLQTEKERDIAAALGPEAYEQYLLRISPSAGNIRNRYGAAIKDEAQYRQIFALQKAFDDQFAPNTPGESPSAAQRQARREAEQQLQQAIATVLGPEQLQVAQRSNDYEYRTLSALTSRLNLPAGTPEQIYAARDTYAVQSQQINANTSLSREERSRQLRALGEQALADLRKTMGTEGAQTYAQRSSWLGILRKGAAFTTNQPTRAGVINFARPGVSPLPAVK